MEGDVVREDAVLLDVEEVGGRGGAELPELRGEQGPIFFFSRCLIFFFFFGKKVSFFLLSSFLLRKTSNSRISSLSLPLSLSLSHLAFPRKAPMVEPAATVVCLRCPAPSQ